MSFVAVSCPTLMLAVADVLHGSTKIIENVVCVCLLLWIDAGLPMRVSLEIDALDHFRNSNMRGCVCVCV